MSASKHLSEQIKSHVYDDNDDVNDIGDYNDFNYGDDDDDDDDDCLHVNLIRGRKYWSRVLIQTRKA